MATRLGDVKVQLEAMFVKNIADGTIPDLQKSFDVDWEFLFFYDGSKTVPKNFPNNNLLTEFKSNFKQKNVVGDTIVEGSEVSYRDPATIGVLLQLTHAYFDDNAVPLGRNLARYILFYFDAVLKNRPNWGWTQQFQIDYQAGNQQQREFLPQNTYGGFNGIRDKDGGTAGLTGKKIKDKIMQLRKDGVINDSIIEFIVWTMRDKPDMWKNLPLWDSFISRKGTYSYDSMDTHILKEINKNIKSVQNGAFPLKGFKFKTWETLNSWESNPVSRAKPNVTDKCTDWAHLLNGATFSQQPPTAKLECFGWRGTGDQASGLGGKDIKLEDFSDKTQQRLQSKEWNLPPLKNEDELNPLGQTNFLQRTKEQIIDSADRITRVGYSKEDAMLREPFVGVKKPDQGFRALLNSKFIDYLKEVVNKYGNVLKGAQPAQRLGQIYNSHLDGTWYDGGTNIPWGKGTPIWVDFWHLMVVMQENIERRTYVQNYIKPESDADGANNAERIEDATIDNLRGEERRIPPPPDPEADLEKIKGRQKFFKQCALLLNALSLRENYNQELKDRCTRTDPNEGPISRNKAVFEERLYMLHHKGYEDSTINNLLGSLKSTVVEPDLEEFPPRIFSYLKPKINLFRINNAQNGDVIETEFIFENRSNYNREANFIKKTNFLNSAFDKGTGAGVKNFSFEFNGTNPAESRNDIEASLTLYFQSFNDFVRERISYNGQKYRFVDLIIQPKNEEAKNKITHPNEYDPSFYKIRAEVGYQVPDNLAEIIKQDDQFSAHDYITQEDFRDSIEDSNKSYVLCMVDHDINVNNDGTVEIKINYRAYVETLLKSNNFDALATKKIIEIRKNNKRQLENVLSSGKCTIEEINELKIAINATEQKIRERSLRSIIERMLNRKKIFIVRVNEKSANYFRRNGFFQSQNVELEDVTDPSLRTPSNQLNTNSGGTVNYILTNRIDNLRDFNYADESDRNVQFFYFGDLIHTICDILYKEDGITFTQESERIRFIFGSFQFNPYAVTSSSIIETLNIAEIPVSVDYFMNWFVDNIISQGEARKTYPMINFIRNLLNSLLQQALLEVCVNKNVEKTFRFQTLSVSPFSDVGHPFKDLTKVDNEGNVNTKLKINRLFNDDIIPFTLSNSIFNADNAINSMHNYVFITAVNSDLKKQTFGNQIDDEDELIRHFNIGSNRGLVKSISFKKTDMQYVREARFFSHGIDGLLQLSSVYAATIEMFGNTLYYPGMTIYINPYGIGGTDIGSPADTTSIANKLGFGGYHTITNIKTSITPDSFNTTISAQWFYSGDGRESFRTNGLNVKNDEIDIEQPNRADKEKNFCNNIIVDSEVNLAKLEQGGTVNDLTLLSYPEPPPNDVENITTTEEILETTVRKRTVFSFTLNNGFTETISIPHDEEVTEEFADGRKTVTYFLNGVTKGIYRTREESLTDGSFITIRTLTLPDQNDREIFLNADPTTTITQTDGE